MWISEQTAIISLYKINLSVFITEAQIVYCAVWTGSSNQIDTVSSLKGPVMDHRLGIYSLSYWGFLCLCFRIQWDGEAKILNSGADKDSAVPRYRALYL